VRIRIEPGGATLDPTMLDALARVELPTLGHFLEVGFAEPGLRRIVGDGRFAGRAVTVRVVSPDSALLHRATELLEPGDVLVIDTGGDLRHAPVGAVVATAAAARGAVGIVIDGPCTDTAALRAIGVPVHARGTSALTTKLHALDAGGINVPVVVGHVAVLPGFAVIGDEDGLLLADPRDVAGALDDAGRADAAEPAKLDRLRAGEPLSTVSAAGERLRPVLGAGAGPGEPS
jgi:4-hydroxy-4-methyl-2-oxoglutarate aldolase